MNIRFRIKATDLYKLVYTKKCWVVLTQFWVKYGQTQLLGYIFK